MKLCVFSSVCFCRVCHRDVMTSALGIMWCISIFGAAILGGQPHSQPRDTGHRLHVYWLPCVVGGNQMRLGQRSGNFYPMFNESQLIKNVHVLLYLSFGVSKIESYQSILQLL